MSPYQYLPLKVDEIRLLCLLPGSFSADVRVLLDCELFSDSNIPIFEALSYTWGSAENPVSISVASSDDNPSNDTDLLVTSNLAAALPYLRYEDRARILWIDAICVNQQDLNERSQQVQRMGDIYSLAERVVVWLGPNENNSTMAMSILQSLSKKIEVDWLSITMSSTGSGELDTEWAELSKPLPYSDIEMKAIYDFLSRPWFGRLWIWQEVRLANPKAILLCGSDSILYHAFRKSVCCVYLKQKNTASLGKLEVKFRERLVLVFLLCAQGIELPFQQLVRCTDRCLCTDPRDRVYALLNLIQKSERGIGIKPDYQSTCAEIYQDVVLRLIEYTKQLDILRSCEMKPKTLSLPSWVADWSTPNISKLAMQGNASGASTAIVQYLGNGVLRLVGVHAATVNNVKQLPLGDSYDEHQETLRTVPNTEILEEDYISGGKMLEAYTRTFCTDIFAEGSVPPPLGHPSLAISKIYLKAVSTSPEKEAAEARSMPGALEYYDASWKCSKGRSFFVTEQGYMGFGPKMSMEGDQVCVFPGCSIPLLLRPVAQGQYEIVGECFVLGLMMGEALLGPLPANYTAISRLVPDDHAYYHGFLDSQTGNITGDPRLKKLPMRERPDGRLVYAEPCMTYSLPGGAWLTAEGFRVLGAKLRDFLLV